MIALGALVALSLCLAFARWSDQLLIAGTVSMLPVHPTAQFNADFKRVITDDPPDTLDPGYGKDVARACATLVDTDCDGRYDLIRVRVFNAYPSYTARITAWVHNGGQMPEQIESIEIEPVSDLDVTISDEAGRVLEPGECVPVTLTVHVRQSASMRAVYEFETRLNCIQAPAERGRGRKKRL